MLYLPSISRIYSKDAVVILKMEWLPNIWRIYSNYAIRALDSIDRAKMRSIIIHYGIPEETVNAIMMLYKNTRSMVISPD